MRKVSRKIDLRLPLVECSVDAYRGVAYRKQKEAFSSDASTAGSEQEGEF
jgi:hypothetical protein